MRVIDDERVRLAYLEAMGLQQWVPREPRTDSTAGTDHISAEQHGGARQSDAEVADPKHAPEPENAASAPGPAESGVGWSITGTPQAWLWLLDAQDDPDNPLLQKIQQACGIRAAAYSARPGGDAGIADALDGVETIVVFGEGAWDASGLSSRRRGLDMRLIQTVALERLAGDPSSKARLWKQLQALL